MRAAILVCMLAGCVEAGLVACPDGDRVCPVGTVCDPTHVTCVSPSQAEVCLGVPDLEPCMADALTGECFDEVCLPRGCGNRVVEVGEVCDDGNRDDGDGCSAVCTSTEVCGNGVVDTLFGETCDDGNRLSLDACDSQCQTETEQWEVEGIAPRQGASGHGAYDPVHHEYMHAAEGILWAWNGTRWALRSVEGPARVTSWRWYQMVFDSGRGHVVFLGGETMGSSGVPLPTDALWAWDGIEWTKHALTGAIPTVSFATATYDPAGNRVILVGQGTVGMNSVVMGWSLDLTTLAWTLLSPLVLPPTAAQAVGSAYDIARGKVVVVIDGAGASVYELAGTTWTQASPAIPTHQWTLAYDPGLGAVIAVGGRNSSNVIVPTILRWTGGAAGTWVTTPQQLPAARELVEIGYDTDRMRRIVFGGAGLVPPTFSLLNVDELREWTGTSWITPTPLAPPLTALFGDPPAVVFDIAHQRIVRVGGLGNETWVHDGSWRKLVTPAPPVANRGSIGYDPVRAASVVTTADETWVLHDETWARLPLTGVEGFSVDSLTYDPIAKQLVAIGNGFSTWFLPSGGDHWITSPVQAPYFLQATVAYDARNARVTLLDSDGNANQLDDGTWSPVLSPNAFGYRVVADQRRGTVLFYSADGPQFERVGAAWIERGRLPFKVNGSATYNPVTGELVILGIRGTSDMILRRKFSNALAVETCAAGADADGDGASGCADADCWWQCTPACPPYATCP